MKDLHAEMNLIRAIWVAAHDTSAKGMQKLAARCNATSLQLSTEVQKLRQDLASEVNNRANIVRDLSQKLLRLRPTELESTQADVTAKPEPSRMPGILGSCRPSESNHAFET